MNNQNVYTQLFGALHLLNINPIFGVSKLEFIESGLETGLENLLEKGYVTEILLCSEKKVITNYILTETGTYFLQDLIAYSKK